VASREDGRDVVIGTATYELSKIKFHVDRQGSLHISGQANNLSDRDFRNPRVYVHLYDTNLVQWALKYGSMVRSSSVLFRSHAAEFDVSFPAFSRTVGAYRIYMNY